MGHYGDFYHSRERARKKGQLESIQKWANDLTVSDNIDEYKYIIMNIDRIVEFKRILKGLVK